MIPRNLIHKIAKNKTSKRDKVWLLALGHRKLLLTIVFIASLTSSTGYGIGVYNGQIKPNKNWLVPGLGAELVYIRPGTFMLGSTKEEQKWAVGPEGKTTAKFILGEGDKPRLVEIKNAFWIGRTEVTVGQWRKFVKATGYKTDAKKAGKAWVYGPNDSKWT